MVKEFFYTLEHVVMRILDVLKLWLFPKFIPIPHFHINKIILVVVIQSIEEYILILCKLIRSSSISSVMITQEYIF